jgi:hypothetical protein
MFISFTRQFSKQGLTGLHQGRREVLTLSQRLETVAGNEKNMARVPSERLCYPDENRTAQLSPRYWNPH